jgi:hypothetical protein
VIQPEVHSRSTKEPDLALRFRPANLKMLGKFNRDLGQHGIHVAWIFMPYTRMFERALLNGPRSSDGHRRIVAEIRRMFGADVLDLSGSVPDELFRDDVHLTRSGARYMSERLAERLAVHSAVGATR